MAYSDNLPSPGGTNSNVYDALHYILQELEQQNNSKFDIINNAVANNGNWHTIFVTNDAVFTSLLNDAVEMAGGAVGAGNGSIPAGFIVKAGTILTSGTDNGFTRIHLTSGAVQAFRKDV